MIDDGSTISDSSEVRSHFIRVRYFLIGSGTRCAKRLSFIRIILGKNLNGGLLCQSPPFIR